MSMNDTAVLYFSLSSNRETANKQLSGSLWKNKQILGYLIRHTGNKLKKLTVPLDVVVWDESSQNGNTFGERFEDAFAQLFERGYQQVIAIGNDCPLLTSADIEGAASILKQNLPVVGPSQDGGVYLMGLSEKQFRSIDFSRISWNTSSVCKEIQSYLQNCLLLEEKVDIDHPTDFKNLSRKSSLIKYILRVQQVEKKWQIPNPVQIALPELQFVRMHCLLPPPHSF